MRTLLTRRQNGEAADRALEQGGEIVIEKRQVRVERARVNREYSEFLERSWKLLIPVRSTLGHPPRSSKL